MPEEALEGQRALLQGWHMAHLYTGHRDRAAMSAALDALCICLSMGQIPVWGPQGKLLSESALLSAACFSGPCSRGGEGVHDRAIILHCADASKYKALTRIKWCFALVRATLRRCASPTKLPGRVTAVDRMITGFSSPCISQIWSELCVSL